MFKKNLRADKSAGGSRCSRQPHHHRSGSGRSPAFWRPSAGQQLAKPRKGGMRSSPSAGVRRWPFGKSLRGAWPGRAFALSIGDPGSGLRAKTLDDGQQKEW